LDAIEKQVDILGWCEIGINWYSATINKNFMSGSKVNFKIEMLLRTTPQ